MYHFYIILIFAGYADWRTSRTWGTCCESMNFVLLFYFQKTVCLTNIIILSYCTLLFLMLLFFFFAKIEIIFNTVSSSCFVFFVVVVVANIRWQFNQYASLLQSYENWHYFFIVILEFSSATVADSDLEHEFVIRILTYSTPTSFRVLLAPLALLDLLVLSVTQARGLVIHMGF